MVNAYSIANDKNSGKFLPLIYIALFDIMSCVLHKLYIIFFLF